MQSKWVWVLAASVSACVGTGSGGGSGGSGGCLPGATNLCLCAPAVQGIQICKEDGKGYAACDCSAKGSGGPADVVSSAGDSKSAAEAASGDANSSDTKAPSDSATTESVSEVPTFTPKDADESEPDTDWSELLDPADTGVADSGPPDSGAKGDGGSDECPERAMIVYVVTKANQLLSFTPDKLAFKLVGTLKCPVPAGMTPFSMGVDREANAWVLFNSAFGQGGPLMKVSTLDASCVGTAFVNGVAGYELFGMGFSSDIPNGLTEKLYLGGTTSMNFALNGGCNLGSLDLKTMQINSVGAIPKNLGCPDMSGNGNAELYGFFPQTNPAQVVKMDKATGQPVKNWVLPAGAFGSVQAWAFAGWGGKFWLFFQGGADITTAVWSLEPATGVAKKVLNNTGYVVVGAGVSSCAPSKPSVP